MADDYSNNSTTTGILLAGGSSAGNFETGSDADWFKTTLQAGTSYLFKMTGPALFAGTVSTFNQMALSLYGADGKYYPGVQSYAGVIDLFKFTPSVSGVYYLEASSSGTASKSPGAYAVGLSQIAPDDFSADSKTTGVFDALGVAKGVVEEKNDRDWFKFHVEAGQHYAFSLESSGYVLGAPSWTVYDASGKFVSSTNPVEPLTAGDYFLSVFASETGTYTVTKKLVTDDYSANDASPGLLAPGTRLTGSLQYSGDIDRFKVDVEAGKFYTYQLTGNAADQPNLQLSVTDSSTSTLDIHREADGTLTATLAAATSGTYSLNVSGSVLLPGGVTHGDYAIKALSPTTDDYGGSAATATPIAIGVSVSGLIQASREVDAFQLQLQAGVTYGIDLAVRDNTMGTVTLPYTIVQPDGSYAAGAHSYTAAVSGTYALLINLNGSTSSSSAFPLAYTVKASLASDDVGASAGNAGLLTLGTPIKGALETDGDRDWYGVALDAGVTYWFTLTGAREGGGTLSSPSSNFGETVKLIDAQGTVVSQVTGNDLLTAPVLSFVPTVKGNYFVEVASPHRDVGTYTLQARIGVTDDYGNDRAHATAIVTGATVAGALEVALDTDVFKFHADAGKTYALEIDSAAVVGMFNNGISLGLTDSAGNQFSYTRDFYAVNKLYRLIDIATSGDYYLSVAAGSGGKAASYTISASALTDDFTGNTQTGAKLSPGVPLQGVINFADDRDWIKVHFDAGKTYVLDLHGSLSGGGSLDTATSGASLALINPAGFQVSGQAGGGSEPRITYVTSVTGDYFVSVAGDARHMGSYTVSVTLTTGDVTAPVLTGGPAATDVGLLGNIVLSFSEAIQLGSGVVLKDSAGAAVPLAPLVTGGASAAAAIGSTLVIDPLKHLVAGTTYTLALPDGGVMDLAGNHYAGARTYTFTTQAAVAAGGTGNDILAGKGNGLALVGGAGTDTAIYGGGKESYEIKIAGGQATVKASGALAGDTLTGVERVLFDTTAIALDIAGNGGQAYRLYQAAFNRTPDQGGVGFWMSALDKGLSLHDVAGNFVASAEFTALYGAAPTDAALVGLLYNNVLHRTGDAAGSAYWVQALHDGASRADVLAAFSESAENQAALVGVIGNGFAYTPYA